MNEKNSVADVTETGKPSANNTVKGPSRRKFLGQVGAALTGGALLGKAVLASAQSTDAGFEDGIIRRVTHPSAGKTVLHNPPRGC